MWPDEKPATQDQSTKSSVTNYKYPGRSLVVQKFLQPVRYEGTLVGRFTPTRSQLHFPGRKRTNGPEPGLQDNKANTE